MTLEKQIEDWKRIREEWNGIRILERDVKKEAYRQLQFSLYGYYHTYGIKFKYNQKPK